MSNLKGHQAEQDAITAAQEAKAWRENCADRVARALWLLRALEQDADINMSAEDIVTQAIEELSQCGP